jgi:GT2 family glycosyltransferase/SAM-dependent methyltransferase
MKFTGEFFIPQNTDQENSNDPGLEIEHKQRYMSVLKLVEGKTILDIACGEGYGSFLMASAAGKVFGVDINPELVEHASQKYKRDNIQYLQGSVSQIPLESNSVDIIISFETLEHVTEDVQIQFFGEVKRVLNTNGIFIVSTPNKKNYTERYNNKNKFHLHELQKDDFETLLKSRFGHVCLYDQGLEVSSLILRESDYLNRNQLAVLPVNNKYHFEGKYLIGLCSDNEEVLQYSIASIVPESERSYFQLIDRIVQLQKEVEDLGAWGTKSAEEIDTLRQHAVDKDNLAMDQRHKIIGLQKQVSDLNIIISEIYASEGWKLLSVFYSIRNKILPQGSPRHQKIKKLVNWARGKKNDNIVATDHTRTGMNPYARTTPTQFNHFEFPYFSNPKVSIIIPAYNGWEMNYLCLRSIRNNTYGVSYEVIFADDISTDETQHVRKYIKNIVHIRNEMNLGFLQNCNHAASFARGEYLHFLNNDTEVTADWLSSLVNLMEKDKTIGMAGSKLVYPDGRLQEAGGIIWQDGSGWNYGHGQDPDASEFNYVKEVDYISGASIMIRKSLWEHLGGFDKMYNPAYCEDSDLAFSVRKAGYKVVFQPLSEVIHFEGFSHGTDAGSQNNATNIKSYQKINAVKFAEKWHSELQLQFPNGVNPFWTRDRSHHKRTIVVIDHYVPHFDKDAGSRTTFQYLELFVELGFNVKFIGDSFYKHEPYTTILQQKGIEVLYGTYYAENWLTWLSNNESYIDYIFLNRPHISTKYIDLIKNKMHAKIFYYTHDLHFFRELMEYEVTRDEKKLKSSAEWKQLEYSLFTKSDVVLTPSSKEKEIIQADFPGKSVQVMPAFFYPSIAAPIRNFKDRHDILFVGGFTHTPNIDGVRWFVNEVFPLIKKHTADIRLIVVGSNAPAEIIQLASSNVIFRGFVTDEELDKLYQSVRFSVIPLRYGGGLKGKTVESLSKALPIVSTSFGVEGLQDIEAIALSYDTATSFAEAVATLYYDIAKLEKLSETISAYSRKHFTKEAASKFFKRLFTKS